jgi:hypothetical protein
MTRQQHNNETNQIVILTPSAVSFPGTMPQPAAKPPDNPGGLTTPPAGGRLPLVSEIRNFILSILCNYFFNHIVTYDSIVFQFSFFVTLSEVEGHFHFF